MNVRSIGIIGVGGVGGYFGGKLCQLQNNDKRISVSFVARGEHLRAIQESGLLLSSESDGELVCRPALATDDFQHLPRLAPFEAKTSFQKDFERLDKNDERDLFAGAMIQLADELGVEVPSTTAVSALLAKRKPARQE